MNFRELMQLVLRQSFVDVTSEFFRRGGGGFVAGELHGGVDFRYVNNSLNGFGNAQMYSPISGTVVSVNGTSDGNDSANGWGWVVIQSDTDGTFHRFLHMHLVDATMRQGTHIDAGAVLGTMGGRGQYRKVRLSESGPLVSVNYLGQEVPGNPTYGYDAYPPHVHYDVFLEAGTPGFQGVGIDSQIDPAVYWTPGLNPYATFDQGTGEPTATGLTVLASPFSDYNGDGVIGEVNVNFVPTSENGAVLKEGGFSLLKLGVNTPHTQAITLRLTFDQYLPELSSLQMTGVGNVTVQADPLSSQVYYVTLPATQSQSLSNTEGYVQLYLGEDADSISRALHYTVEAGYMSGGSWRSYNAASATSSVFTPVINRTLLVLDNDSPQFTPDPNRIIQGSDEANLNHFTPNYSDPDLEGISGGARVHVSGSYNGFSGGYRDQWYGGVPTGSFDRVYLGPVNYEEPEQYWGPDADAIYGNGGDDWLAGPGAVSQARVLIDGGAGDDFILASITGDKLPVRTDGTGAPSPGEAGAVIHGGIGHDFVLGQWRDDWIEGGADHDQIFGLAGPMASMRPHTRYRDAALLCKHPENCAQREKTSRPHTHLRA